MAPPREELAEFRRRSKQVVSEVKREREEKALWAPRDGATEIDQSRDKLVQLVEASGEMIAMADLDGRITYMNESGRRMIGLDLEGTLGDLTVLDLVPPEWRSFFLETVHPAVCATGRWEGEMQIRNVKTGQLIDVQRNSFLVRDPQTGKPWCFATVTRDITQQKAAAAILAERSALLDTLFKEAPVGMGFVDREYRYVRMNEKLAAINGCTPEGCVGRTIEEIVPDLWPTLKPLYEKVLSGRSVLDVQISGKTHAAPGQVRHWIGNYYPVRVARKIIGIGIAVIDVTDRIRAAEALRQSELRYRQLIQSLPVPVYTCDAEGRILLYNEASVRLWGRKPSKTRRWCGSYRTYAADGTLLARDALPIARAVKEDRVVRGDPRIIERPDGERSYVLGFPDPIHDLAGRVIGAVNVLIDITALKETEFALRTTQRKLRTLSEAVHQSPASVIVTNPAGEIEYVNPKFTEVTGYQLCEALGQNPRMLKSGRQTPAFYEELWKTISSGREWRGEFCNRRRNGEEFWEYAVIAPIHDEQGKVTHFVAIKEDITEQRRAAEALHDSEERLRATLNTVADAVITTDAEARIVAVNPATERMFGYPEAELLGQPVRLLLSSPYEENQDLFLGTAPHQKGTRLITGGREVVGHRSDGSTFPAELSVGEVKHMQLFTAVARDITERKRLENEVLAISEDERQRVAADLHDGICQELMGISFTASALQREIAETAPSLVPKIKAIAEGISASAGHTRSVARGMNPLVADGNALMHSLRQLAVEVNDTRSCRCEFECRHPVVIADTGVANQLYRIAQEAVHNAARHARAKRIVITLAESATELRLAVRDNGCGIPQGVLTGPGLGLRTMRYRAGLIGAMALIQPRKGGGTEVLCRIQKSAK